MRRVSLLISKERCKAVYNYSYYDDVRDKKKHYKMLDEINSRKKGSVGLTPKESKVLLGNGSSVMNSAKIQEELKKYEEKIKKNKEFLVNEKNLEINRSNQALLNKLVEISTGKWSSVHSRDRSLDIT